MKAVHCCYCGGTHQAVVIGFYSYATCDKAPRGAPVVFKKCICPPESRTLPKEDGKNE